MLKFSFRKSPLHVGLLAAAFGIGLAASASAQDSNRYAAPAAYKVDEEITVSAPRHAPYRGEVNLPTEQLSQSQPVRYDDLDLTTNRDVHILHERIVATARDICHNLSTTYPDAVWSSPSCYTTAIDNAEPRAIAAIDRAHARSGSY